MSRSRDAATELLFLLIKDHFDLPATTGTDFNRNRWIKGDVNDAHWLTYSKVAERYLFSAERQFCRIEFEKNHYFVAAGFGQPDRIPFGFIEFEINAGLFVAVVSELELPVLRSVSTATLEEKVLSQHEQSDQYAGHDYHDLVSTFPDLFVAEITKDFIGDPENLVQLAAYYLASNRSLLDIPYTSETLNEVILLISTNSNILNYENILQALLASQFKFAYLDLYRCIELLYQVIYISETSNALGMANNQFKVLSAVDETLGWRPVEIVALTKIFSETPKAEIQKLGEAIKAFDRNIKNFSTWMYMLRNSIVHLKPIHKSVDLKNSHWEPILRGTIQVLKHWYHKYHRFE